MNENSIIANINSSLDATSSIESVIKLILESCFYKEAESLYYNLPIKESKLLSEERNHYINLLSITLEKVCSLRTMLLSLEQDSDNSSR